MALQTVKLEEAAKAFGVHPRTILRAIKGAHNTYWYEDSNSDDIEIADIARAYGTTPKALVAVFEGRDSLLLADEAAEVLSMAARTFRKHLKDRRNAKEVGSGGSRRDHPLP